VQEQHGKPFRIVNPRYIDLAEDIALVIWQPQRRRLRVDPRLPAIVVQLGYRGKRDGQVGHLLSATPTRAERELAISGEEHFVFALVRLPPVGNEFVKQLNRRHIAGCMINERCGVRNGVEVPWGDGVAPTEGYRDPPRRTGDRYLVQHLKEGD
jgi:hypothetical protein